MNKAVCGRLLAASHYEQEKLGHAVSYARLAYDTIQTIKPFVCISILSLERTLTFNTTHHTTHTHTHNTHTTHTHEQKEANPLFPYTREVQAVQNDVGHVFRLYNMQNNHVWVQKVRSKPPSSHVP
jgi:hypothetical protein